MRNQENTEGSAFPGGSPSHFHALPTQLSTELSLVSPQVTQAHGEVQCCYQNGGSHHFKTVLLECFADRLLYLAL